MNLYKIILSVPLYNPSKRSDVAMKFEAEFEAKEESHATKQAKEWYAMEFGTTEDQVTIHTVKQIV